MNSISSIMGEQKLLPIIQVNNADDGVDIAKAMYEANLRTVEAVSYTHLTLPTTPYV